MGIGHKRFIKHNTIATNYMKEILIKIQVCGFCATGKTTIAGKIGSILKREGFDVKLIDDDEGYTIEEIERNLKALAPNVDVIIETQQLCRTFITAP